MLNIVQLCVPKPSDGLGARHCAFHVGIRQDLIYGQSAPLIPVADGTPEGAGYMFYWKKEKHWLGAVANVLLFLLIVFF